ncbi:unnamed protein product [Angiostrongylus costaricensis]|uniref:TPT domain-containing protein n=1 Tax=Angiostrongylus costaricensis TaxID=334426 RepID=A0A0R3Q2B4_ANGCS|nr:unnamed protein product [Angiostrongylus costaricensis]
MKSEYEERSRTKTDNTQVKVEEALPYTIYLLCLWNPVHLDLNPYYVMIASTPFIAQLKINLTLTVSIAAERILALSFPVVFRKLSSYPYTTFCLMLGFLLAAIDLTVEFSLSPFNKTPNCPSVGCFLSNTFSYYLGISNMVSFSFLEKHLSSSVVVGVCGITGFSLTNIIGPFYTAGLLCAGVCNGVVQVVQNKDMLRALGCKCVTAGGTATVEPVKTSSTRFITQHLSGLFTLQAEDVQSCEANSKTLKP